MKLKIFTKVLFALVDNIWAIQKICAILFDVVKHKPLSGIGCWVKAYQEMIWEFDQILPRCNQIRRHLQKCSHQARPKIIILKQRKLNK